MYCLYKPTITAIAHSSADLLNKLCGRKNLKIPVEALPQALLNKQVTFSPVQTLGTVDVTQLLETFLKF